MKNNKRHARRIPWITIALVLILLGAIMIGTGWISGFRGGSLIIEDGRLRVVHDWSGEIETTFMEIPDGDRFTDIHIRARAPTILVRPADPDAPLSLKFTNLEANVEYSGNQLIIDTRDHERRNDIPIIHFNYRGPDPRGVIVVHLPAGKADSVRITNTFGNIRIDDISITLLEVRSTSGRISGRNLNFTNGTLESSSGNINLNDASWNDLNARTISGQIRIAGADIGEGSTQLHTTSGNIQMDDISATLLEARSTSGRIGGRNLSFTSGTLESSSGNISLNDVSWNNLNARTISGQIRIAGADIREGGTQLQATSGNINLEVRSRRDDFTYNLTATAGSVRINGERLQGRMGVGGRGEHPITMNVTSGNIRLDFDP